MEIYVIDSGVPLGTASQIEMLTQIHELKLGELLAVCTEEQERLAFRVGAEESRCAEVTLYQGLEDFAYRALLIADPEGWALLQQAHQMEVEGPYLLSPYHLQVAIAAEIETRVFRVLDM